MRRVLVTGAGGYVGRPAVAALAARGFSVHGVSRAGAPARGAVGWHHADLLAPAEARRIVRAVRPTDLLHLAWTTGHGQYWTSPDNGRWEEATAALLRAFAEVGGRRAVLASTCAVYDWTAGSPLDERESPCRPATPYGLAKLRMEEHAQAFGTTAGLSVASGRLFFSFGPGEQPQRLVPSLLRPLLAGEPALCTAGTQALDFLHIEDVGRALAALLESAVSGAVNIASGMGVPVADVARRLGTLTGRPDLIRLGALPSRANQPERLVGAAGRLTHDVGFTPRLTLDEGLAHTVLHWKRGQHG